MGKNNEFEIPTIVLLSEVLTQHRTTKAWEVLVVDVREACERYGCFLVKYDQMTLEKHQKLFEEIKSMFDVPKEQKELFKRDNPIKGGYLGTNPYLPLSESFGMKRRVEDDIQTLENLMWPQGNTSFCNVMNSTHSMFQHLGSIIMELIFEGLGIKNHFALKDDHSIGLLRIAKYHIPEIDNKSSLGLVPHIDKSAFTFICQNEVQGLEILSSDGNWSELVIPDGFLLFQLGDVFEVWSNGRFRGVEHKVMIKGKSERYTYSSFVCPNDESIIEVPQELVDDEHPLLYRPFVYKDYLSETSLSQGLGSTLRSYAGI